MCACVRAGVDACDCSRVHSKSRGKPVSSAHFILTRRRSCRALTFTRRRPRTASDSTNLPGSTEADCKNYKKTQKLRAHTNTLLLCNAPGINCKAFLQKVPRNCAFFMSHTPRNTCLLARTCVDTCILCALNTVTSTFMQH